VGLLLDVIPRLINALQEQYGKYELMFEDANEGNKRASCRNKKLLNYFDQ
jgi:hypothetical protein